MKNHIVWESRQEDIKCPIPRPLVFFGPQRNPNEPPMYFYNKDLFFLKHGNTEEKNYILSLHKIQAKLFPEADQEEKMNRWVRKAFKTFNEKARLSIQHWEDSWHKMMYKKKQRRVRSNPEDYFSKRRITRLVLSLPKQEEIVKFCDATLEKVLKEVKLKIFQSEPWKKSPVLGKLDRDIMRAFEREITKRLNHREQIRRWESFANEIPILLTMKRL
uniref:Uncharacterized protein n=1 Tax=Tanacetum cinerariifolium TaxID=118510 RepID=A0A6L2K254_TANCI|nr:hypothetical protein [Tanacetum cinerariifolium]